MRPTRGCLYTFLLLSFVATLTCFKISSFDVWWHLATGKWIVENFSIPYQDPFSYTVSNKTWFDFSWLFQTMIYTIYKLLGVNGLIVFKVLTAVLTFLFLYKLLLRLKISNFFALSLSLSVLFISYGRFMVRPHIFSFLFFVIFLYLFLYWMVERKDTKKFIITFSPLYLAWLNIHTSFILVFIFLFIALIAYLLFRKFQEAWEILISKITLLCLTVVNPYGLELPIKVLSSHFSKEGKEALIFINEWQPYNVAKLFYLQPNQELVFKILFWTAILSIVHSVIKKRLSPLSIAYIAITVLTIYMFLSHKRFIPLFALISSISIAQMLSEDKKKQLITSLILTISILPAAWITFFKSVDFKQNFGFGIKHSYPFQTVNFLKNNHIKGNLFNSYGFGGFIIWNLYPKYKVFIDGRTPTLYSSDFFWEYRIAESPNLIAFEHLKSTYKFSIVLTKSKELASKLINDKNWCFVGIDDRAYLFTTKEAYSSYCITKFNPTESINQVIETALKSGEIEELEKELRYLNEQFPNTGIINNALGTVLFFREKFKEAIPFFEKAYKILPSNAKIPYNLGACHLKLKNYHTAENFFKKAIELGILSEIPKTLYYLGFTYYREHKFQKAIKTINRYLLTSPKAQADPAAFETLGMSYYQLKNYDFSIKFLKRAIFLTKDYRKKAKLICNLANAYLAKGRVEEAKRLYTEALKLLPSLKAAKENLKLIGGGENEKSIHSD